MHCADCDLLADSKSLTIVHNGVHPKVRQDNKVCHELYRDYTDLLCVSLRIHKCIIYTTILCLIMYAEVAGFLSTIHMG